MVNIGNDWDALLKDEFTKDYYLKLREFLKSEYSTRVIYPSMYDIFNALKHTAYKDVKAVILGQDPYHQKGQAHGMCFSVNPGVQIPPSLMNIYKELHEELGCYMPDNGYLMPWAKQGVFLLNTVLTVRDSSPKSHAGKGWEVFTDHAIQKISASDQPVVFLLWGRDARSKAQMIDRSRHLVLEAAHPSPLSAYNGFFGCGHFRTANAFLKDSGRGEISWQIPNLMNTR